MVLETLILILLRLFFAAYHMQMYLKDLYIIDEWINKEYI